jgi:hypothetical protein
MIDQNQILWDERNSTELQNSCKNKNEQEINDITKSIKTNSMPNDWRSIIDPKLRKKAYHKAYAKTYRVVNRDKMKTQRKAYREANKDKIKIYDKAYSKRNKDKINNRYKTDIRFKISKLLRSRLLRSLKNEWKSGSAVKDLGCTIDEFKTYLESKFQLGMNWNNHGPCGWHIDHIKPLASFDLTDRKQLLMACHYTNLQPLWATDNLIKGDKQI